MRNCGKIMPTSPYHGRLYRMKTGESRSVRGKCAKSPACRRFRVSYIARGAAVAIACAIMASCAAGLREPGRPLEVKSRILRFEGAGGVRLEMASLGSSVGGFWYLPSGQRYGRVVGSLHPWGRIDLELGGAGRTALGLRGRFALDGTLVIGKAASGAATIPGAEASRFEGRCRKLETAFETRGFSAYAGDLSLLTITSADPAAAALLDGRLRRGNSPRDYAIRLGDEYLRGKTGAKASGQPGASLTERQYVAATAGPFVSIATERYYFEGGAHGNTALSFITLDWPRALANGRPTLDPEDILPAGLGDPGFMDRLEARARLELGLAEGQGFTKAGFFEDKLPPPGDFFVTEQGLGLQYDRYELAPYSYGDFLFIVPWDRLEGLLAPDFPQRLRSSP